MSDTTWTRDGLTFSIAPSPDGETKATGSKWTAAQRAKHPRDRKGKFIETGAEVRILGSGLARVLGQAGPGRTRVQTGDGKTRDVPNDYLTVTKRPDGSAPGGKPATGKPATAAPPTAPGPGPGASASKLNTPDAVRAHWATGAQSSPDLPDGQREFVKQAAQHAADIQLAKSGNLVLLQLHKDGPWQVTNLHGQRIGPEQSDQAAARKLADRLVTEVVDAEGKPLDFNAPGFAERAKSFRTAKGESLTELGRRIFAGGKGEGGKTPPKPRPGGRASGDSTKGPKVNAEDVARVREIQAWKPLNASMNMWGEYRAHVRSAAGDFADALESGKGHAIIAAYDRLSAALYAARTQTRREHYLSPSPRVGSSRFRNEEDVLKDIKTRTQGALLRWHAAEGDRPQGPRFTSVDQVRDHLADGGDSGPVLNSTGRGLARDVAEQIGPDTRLVGDGSFIVLRDSKTGKWKLRSSATGGDMPGVITQFETPGDASDFADQLKQEINHDWDHPQSWLTATHPGELGQIVRQDYKDFQDGRTSPGPAQEKPAPTPRPKEQGPPKLDTPEAVRAYWASGGAPDQKLPPPDSLRILAKEVHDLRLSGNGTLVLVQDRQGGKWRLTNLHGGPLPSIVNQSSLARAQQMADRIEGLTSADGNAFDWNAPGFADRVKTWHTANHLDIRLALAEAADAQKEANKPKPKPTPEVTPKITTPGQPITSVDQLRQHLAAGGDEPPGTIHDAAKRIATAKGLELVAGNSFFIRPAKPSSGGRQTWTVHHAHTSQAAAPRGREFTHDEAKAFAEGMKKLYDENGDRFNWDAPNVNERLRRIPDESRSAQVTALLNGEEPPQPDGSRPLPKPATVKAATLARGDTINAGQVEDVTRVGDLTFVTVRDGEDRRSVQIFAPGADAQRLSASGERAPDPVSVADAPAGDVGEGDRVLLPRSDGAWLPATVLSVADEGDTRRLEVRYGDGRTETVLADRGEALPRLGGAEAAKYVDGTSGGEPADEPPVTATPVEASTLTEGDRITFPSGDIYAVVAADHSGRSTALTVRRERDGAQFDFGFGKTQQIHKLVGAPSGGGDGQEPPTPAPERAVPDALPKGVSAARPVLYTYQRRNLNWLGLDASDDPAVRQAALRVRDRLPLSADQAAALAGAVRARAADQPPGRQRTAERLAHSLDAAAAEARGVPAPRRPIKEGGAFRSYAKNMVEGDTVALPVAQGRARIGKVTGTQTLMGGRLVQLDVQYGDGTTERRLLTARTDGYVLPDLPPDVPVPPPGPKIEHIMPGQIRVGDVLRDPVYREEREVTAVEWSGSDDSARIRWKPVKQDPSITYDTSSSEHLISHDGGPSAVRLRRGEASADQPWGLLIEEDANPVQVSAGEVQAGDRVSIVRVAGDRPVVGTVIDVRDLVSKGGTAEPGTVVGKVIRVRRDDGSRMPVTVPDSSPVESITRLKAADANTIERMRQEQIQREQQRTTRHIAELMSSVVEDVYISAAARGRIGVGTSEWHTLDEIDKVSFAGVRAIRDPVNSIISHLGVTDAATTAEMQRRLTPIVDDLISGARDRVKDAVRQAKPLPGEDAADARRRVLNQYYKSPPTDIEAHWSPASTLAALRQAFSESGSGGAAAAVLAHVPEVGHIGDLGARMDAYRTALGDGADFGRARVKRAVMAQTTLADLDAGKVPAIETVEVGVVDTAPDSGPGEAAMRHLDIVRAAGRDLDAEMARLLDQRGAVKAQDELNTLTAAKTSFAALRDRIAREAGYPDFSDLITQNRRAQYGSDEHARLSQLQTDFHQRAHAEYRAQVIAIDDLTKRIADERRRAALEVLARVRPDGVGGVQITWHANSPAQGYKELTGRSELVKAMRFAEASYPRGWLEHFRDHAGKQKWKVGKIKRGHYNDHHKLINLSDGQDQTTDGGKLGHVAVHEMGHGMEQAIPGLLAAQRAFLWDRTSSGPVNARTRQKKTAIYKGEYGYKDDFPEHYTGKDYINPNTGRDYAYEVFTTGMESLTAGSTYLDDDFRRFMLGTLALLGTTERSDVQVSPAQPSGSLSAPMLESLKNLAAAGGTMTAFREPLNRAGIKVTPLRALVRRGLVEQRTEGDRGSWTYVITEKGRALLAEYDNERKRS